MIFPEVEDPVRHQLSRTAERRTPESTTLREGIGYNSKPPQSEIEGAKKKVGGVVLSHRFIQQYHPRDGA